MARKKGNKDYTKLQKPLLVSLIIDYYLFGSYDEKKSLE